MTCVENRRTELRKKIMDMHDIGAKFPNGPSHFNATKGIIGR